MTNYSITRGTTPTVSIRVPEVIPLGDADEIWVTFTQGGKILADHMLSDGSVWIDGLYVRTKLSQEETLSFKSFIDGEVGMRIYRDSDGMAWALDPQLKFDVRGINKGGIIGLATGV